MKKLYILSMAFIATMIQVIPSFAQNLIVNGDFSQGDTLFTTSYTATTGTGTPGQYSITTNPTTMNSAYCSIGDHTTGTGNMMVIDGSLQGSTATIWSQTVPVLPNTSYTFSISAVDLYAGADPAILAVDINGLRVTTHYLPQGPYACQWQQYQNTWNSQSDTLLRSLFIALHVSTLATILPLMISGSRLHHWLVLPPL